MALNFTKFSFFFKLFPSTNRNFNVFYAPSSAAGKRRVFPFSFPFERNKDICIINSIDSLCHVRFVLNLKFSWLCFLCR